MEQGLPHWGDVDVTGQSFSQFIDGRAEPRRWYLLQKTLESRSIPSYHFQHQINRNDGHVLRVLHQPHNPILPKRNSSVRLLPANPFRPPPQKSIRPLPRIFHLIRFALRSEYAFGGDERAGRSG